MLSILGVFVFVFSSDHLKKLEINWRAQSKNDPLIFRPFLKVSTCQNSTTSEHFQKWPKNQGIVLALSPPIRIIPVFLFL